MNVDLEVNFSDGRWRRFDFTKYVNLLFKTGILLSKIPNREVLVSLLACNNKEIKELNKIYLGKNKYTNVLAWPAEHKNKEFQLFKYKNDARNKTFLGDIAISFDYCLNESKIYKKGFDDHCCHLLIHAVLHLIGYDHLSGNDASKMKKMENRILNKIRQQTFHK